MIQFGAYGETPLHLAARLGHLDIVIIRTSGKNFIKITSVGMGAAKSNETR